MKGSDLKVWRRRASMRLRSHTPGGDAHGRDHELDRLRGHAQGEVLEGIIQARHPSMPMSWVR